MVGRLLLEDGIAFTECMLTDNLAIYGGGIYQRASQISMFDGSISNNEATYAAAVRRLKTLQSWGIP